jgi:hypothetical protein
MLRIERLPGPEALEALAPEVEALEASLSPRVPFTSWLWNALWWKHYRADRLFVRDEFFVHVVRDEAGALVALAPMMLTHRPSFAPLRVRILQFFGADENVTEIRGPLCRPEHLPGVVEALGNHFRQREDDWDWVDWRGLNHGGMVNGQGDTIRDYYLRLPPSWDELRASLSRNMKEALRKCHNSPRSAGVCLDLHVAAGREECKRAMPRFFALHATRAQGRGLVHHRDVFHALRARRFLSHFAARMAERGRLRIFELRDGSDVIASRVGFLLGDELYLYYSGYDPRFAAHSVMTRLMAETIQWAIAEGLKVVNLSTGHDLSKARWRPQEAAFASMTQPSPTMRGMLAYRAYQGLVQQREPGSRIERALAFARR